MDLSWKSDSEFIDANDITYFAAASSEGERVRRGHLGN